MPPRLLALASLCFLAACDEGLVCPAIPVGPSVIVLVEDVATHATPDDPPPGIVFRSGYVDSLRPYHSASDGHWIALAGGTGTASLTARIEAPGYQPWQRSGLHAVRQGCAIQAAEVRAELVPE